MRNIKKALAILLVVVIAVGAFPGRIIASTSYGDETAQELLAAERVEISNGENIDICIGLTQRLEAVFYPENCATETLYWTSDNPLVAEVNEYGEVTGLSIGEANIIVATENGLTDVCTVTVKESHTLTEGLPVLITISDNRYEFLEFVPSESGNYKFYTSEVSNDNSPWIILYDSATNSYYYGSDYFDCQLTGGNTYYILTNYTSYSEEPHGTYYLNVTKAVAAERLTILSPDICGYEGSSLLLKTKFSPDNSIVESITFSSDNSSVVTVDEYGYATFVSEGTTTVTAVSENGLTDSVNVTVIKPDVIELNETKTGTVSNEVIDSRFVFVPDEDGEYMVRIESEYECQAHIEDSKGDWLNSSSGRQFAFSTNMIAGQSYLLCTEFVNKSEVGTYFITVEKLADATSMEIVEGDSYIGYVGDEYNFCVVFGPENAKTESVFWTSDNPDVVNVTEYGYVQFVSEGTATVIATSENGLTDTIFVTVFSRQSATAIEISNGDVLTSCVGGKQNLWVNYFPEGCIPEALYWTSDNTEVATVNREGIVSCLSAGTANITVTSESGLTDSCTIQVKEPYLLTMEQSVRVTINNNYNEYVKFVPAESGLLRIYISDNSNENDPLFDLYDSNMNWLAHEKFDNILDYEFTAGETYYIKTNYAAHSENGGSYTFNVTELAPATSISLDIGTQYSGYIGTTKLIWVVYSPFNAVEEPVTWSTTNPEVVSVSQNGWIYLNAAGQATITAATEGGLTASCVVTVNGYSVIVENQEQVVSLNADNPCAYFSFTPSEDGYYSFSSNAWYDTCGRILDSNFHELAFNDDGGPNGNFNVGYQMQAGVTYILEARFCDSSIAAGFGVVVKKSKYITDLEIISMPYKTEYVEGCVTDYLTYDGLTLRATWSDGSTTDWTANTGDNFIGGQMVGFDPSLADENGIVTIHCGGKTATFALTLIENPVDYIVLVSGTEQSYIENQNGYFTTNQFDEQFYFYNTKFPHDAQIKIVYKNGTSTIARVGTFVDGYDVRWNDNQYLEPWVLGNNNNSYITYLGHSVVLPITVKNITVTSIEIVSGKLTYIENTNGHYEDFGFFYHYEVSNDVKIKINYGDGSFIIVGANENVDGFWIDTNDCQREIPWVVGDDNYLLVSYLGATTQLPVTILANPVKSIEIITAPTREYIYGDEDYGYLYPDGSYEFEPSDLTGLSFAVYYTDGTSKIFTYEDISNGTIDEDYCEIECEEMFDPSIGDLAVTFTYMGSSDTYTVKMKETTVESVAVTKNPNKTEYGKEYMPDFIGTEITVTYLDGTTKTVTFTEENTTYRFDPFWGGHYCYVELDGHNLMIACRYYEDISYIVSYMGVQCEIVGITSVSDKEVEKIELGSVSSNGDGMTVTITYTDETVEILSLTLVDYFKSMGGYAVSLANTQNGLISYTIETFADNNGEIEKYIVYIFGEEITVELNTVTKGDVNGDGVIDADDANAFISILFAAETLDDAEIELYDFNGDGKVSASDMVRLKRYIAGEDVTIG